MYEHSTPSSVAQKTRVHATKTLRRAAVALFAGQIAGRKPDRTFRAAGLFGAVVIGALIAGGGHAFAISAGCSALASGSFDSLNGGYQSASTGTGFDAGDRISVTYAHGNAGSTYTLRDTTASTVLYGPSSVSHTSTSSRRRRATQFLSTSTIPATF
jgi:hypothetical protein